MTSKQRHLFAFLALLLSLIIGTGQALAQSNGHFKKTLVVSGELAEIKAVSVVIKVEKVKPQKLNDDPESYPKSGDLIELKVTDKTKLVRKYGGKSGLDEFNLGDSMVAAGVLSDVGLEASLVKDNSIRRLFFLQSGKITTLDSAKQSFDLTKNNGQKETILIVTKTKIIKNAANLHFPDLAVGENVQVRGILNKKFQTIEASLIRIR